MNFRNFYAYICLIIILSVLSACSNESEAESHKEESESNKGVEEVEENIDSIDVEQVELQETEEQKAVRKAVEAYINSIQGEDYEAAYESLSNVYKNAGITVGDLKQDFSRSRVDFSRYNLEIYPIRNRNAKETSETNIDEEFMLVRIFFKHPSQTREDAEEFPGSDVKWLDERIWLHKENEEWKFYALDDQSGVTWKPDVYEAVMGFMESIKTKESNRIFSHFSGYYGENGYTAEDTEHFGIRQGDVKGYRILSITDELGAHMNFDIKVGKKLARVEVGYIKSDPDQLAGKEVSYSQSWIFHLEEGTWKVIAMTPGDLRKSAVACYIEENCDELFDTNWNEEKESSVDRETDQPEEGTKPTKESKEEPKQVASDVMPLNKRDFNFMGVWVGMPLDKAQEILGSEFERAGEGELEVYAYDGFSLYSGIGEQRFGIEFIDSTLVTERGISKEDSLEKLLATYGEDYEEEYMFGIRSIHYKSEEHGAVIRFSITEQDEINRITYEPL
ncbi:hypothetical protein DXT76_06550 [Halobacillus trueperi]|uniref:DUF4309 domain-containing protein n=1 Tax=Halobacillus trueperi TaxID=156205 RepID=A0A3D8VS99_9BACI|nr:hypothetical protein [Halobacillus trueperi]RDY71658.1 hypothetical protein DXT76_06550 [Halobacillus trueperi]